MSKRPPDDLDLLSNEDDNEDSSQEQIAKRQKVPLDPETSSSDDVQDEDFETGAKVGTKGEPLGIRDAHGEWLTVPGFSSDKLRVSTLGYYVIRMQTGGWTKPSLGYQTSSGYRTVMIDKIMYKVHFITCTAFWGVRPDSSYTPQHGLGGKGDNSIENIKGWATPTQQAKEYRTQSKAKRNGKPIVVWKQGEDEAHAVYYPSSTAAAQATGAKNLRKVANGEYKHSSGYHAKWAEALETQEDLPAKGKAPDEEWREVNSKLWVSNRGRACYKDARGNGWGHRFTPKVSASNEYADIKVGGETKLFHRVVFLTFGGVLDEVQCQVDHIDRIKSNNELHNLRSASPAENLANRTLKNRTEILHSLKKAVRGRPVGTIAWTFEKPSITEAAEALTILLQTKVWQSSLGVAIRNSRPYNGWEFQFVPMAV